MLSPALRTSTPSSQTSTRVSSVWLSSNVIVGPEADIDCPTDQYGIPLDTRHTYTKSDWQIYTAGVVTDTNLRNQMISAVKGFVSAGKSNAPFPDWYVFFCFDEFGLALTFT